MNSLPHARYSLKTRITLTTLTIFVIGLWSLSFFASTTLRRDMERQLGEQQLSVVTAIASDINQHLADRIAALEAVAPSLIQAIQQDPAAIQAAIEQRPILPILFNAGFFVTDSAGTAIASIPTSVGRVGVNYMDRDFIAAAINEGKATIGRPVVGKKLQTPVIPISVPIRNGQGKVIGALTGTTNLGIPNFLDRIIDRGYGKTGGYLLVAPQYRLLITATDKRRMMQPLPELGVNPHIDRFIEHCDGYAVYRSVSRIEQLDSCQRMPVSGWDFGATQPTDEAFAPIHAMQHNMLLATLFLTLIAGGITWWMLRRQLAPMTAAASMLSSMADSNARPQALPIVSHDEIGALVGGFNHLLEVIDQRGRALVESDDRYRDLVENTQDLIVRVDLNGRFVFVNESSWRIFGLAPEACIGLSAFTFVHPEDLEATQQSFAESVRAGTTQLQLEDRQISRDGAIHLMQWEISGRHDAAGKIIGFNGVARDVTQMRATEKEMLENRKALSDSLALLEVTGKIASVGGWSLDVETHALTWSLETYRIHELVPSQPIDVGRAIRFYAPEGRQAISQTVSDCIQHGRLFDLELPLITTSGKSLWVRAQGQAEFCDGKTVRIFGAFQDITERKRIEAELIAAKQGAENASLAKSRFLAAASHDLRQPMQAIDLFQCVLARTDLNLEQKRILSHLGQSSRSMGEILNALLDISRLDAAMVQVNREIIQAQSLVQQIDAEFSPLATNKSLRFKLSFPFRDMTMLADGKLLMRLLRNLIGNAIKYTDKGGVLVAIRHRGHQALIQVWDTGIGIAGEHLDTIYEEYFQVSNAERDRSKGLGLGLAIARRIANLLETEIRCHSRPGKGSVFEFRLPLARGGENAPSSQSNRLKALPAKPVTCHVVLVEDDPMVRTATKLALESCGMTIACYKTAEEALADPEIAGADFYISDLRLPGKNGIEFLDAVQQRATKQVKAVVLTGDTAVNRIEMMRLTSWQVLFKPVDLATLLAAIEARDSEL